MNEKPITRNIEVYHIEVADNQAYRLPSEVAVSFHEIFNEKKKNKEDILVHCSGGRGRTAQFIMERILQDKDSFCEIFSSENIGEILAKLKARIEELREIRPGFVVNPTQLMQAIAHSSMVNKALLKLEDSKEESNYLGNPIRFFPNVSNDHLQKPHVCHSVTYPQNYKQDIKQFFNPLLQIQKFDDVGLLKSDNILEQDKDIYSKYINLYKELKAMHAHDVRRFPNKYTNKRYTNVFTLRQEPFSSPFTNQNDSETTYPAAQIGGMHSDVLAEGPFEENFEYLLSALEKKNISTIFAIGSPGNGKKYFDYMHTNSCEEIKLTTFSEHFPECFDLNILTDLTLKFYKYTSKEQNEFKIIYIPSWEDHGLSKFTNDDECFLAHLLKNLSAACFHCSAGIGRSVAVLMIKMLLKKLSTEEYVNQNFDSLVRDVFNEILQIKPGAAEIHQFLTVPGLARDFWERSNAPILTKDPQKILSSSM